MAKVEDISIPMNGSYRMEIIDRKTKQKYTIRLDVVKNATKGTPVMIDRYSVKHCSKKEQELPNLQERKKRLSVGIEKLF